MKHTLIILVLMAASFISPAQKKVLGIFAHPDDEGMIAGVLAKFAREGNTVRLIFATDGSDGTRVTKIPAGDSLGNIRKQESICACEKMGIQPPIFLSFKRLDTKQGVRSYLNDHTKFIDTVKSLLNAIEPDIIITFGPDGEYGHSEHIVVGGAVTELLLKEGLAEKYPVYFPVSTKEQVADDPQLSYINKQYITAEIAYTDEDERRSFEAFKCYETQFTPAEMQETIELQKSDKTNTQYFRKFLVSKNKRIKKRLF